MGYRQISGKKNNVFFCKSFLFIILKIVFSLSLALVLFRGDISFANANDEIVPTFKNRGLLDLAGREFVPLEIPRVGLEIEYVGVSLSRSAQIIADILDGNIEILNKTFDYKDPITQVLQTLPMISYKIRTPFLGKVRVKMEENGTSFTNLADRYSTTDVIEIVSEPLDSLKRVEMLQLVLDELVRSGAEGTKKDLAVSIQVNVEIGKGDRHKIHVKQVLDILRNYLSLENRTAISLELAVPDIRAKYMGGLTPGFYNRVMNLKYSPTWKQFYEDAMYRQSLELLGDREAWSLPRQQAIQRVQAVLNAEGSVEKLLPVMKWNYVRISSLMMFMQPQEWLSKALYASGWVKPHPLLEFREMNNDFNLTGGVKKIVGFVHASSVLGPFSLNRKTGQLQSHASGSRPQLVCRNIFSF